jgi:hypothetical protein
MSGNPDYEALVEQLRNELTKAEEKFREATTPESKQEALDRFEQALDRYSRLILRQPTGRSGAEET